MDKQQQQQSEEEEVQMAFEQFMMGGGKKKKKNTTTITTTRKHNSNNNEKQVLLKKAEKQYWTILNAFRGTLERNWMHADDQLEQLVASISNLRGRTRMESRYLYMEKSKTMKPWSAGGYRRGAVNESGLTRDDVELALSHDLLQHEKMMAGARTLLSSLSDAQEALARRLDEWMLHDMDTLHLMQSLGDVETSPSSLETVMGATDKLQDVFASLALELYRKQLLIQSLLDAVNDDLLVRNDDDDDDDDEKDDLGMDVNPRRVAEKCLREWPRGSKESHVDVKVLDALLELGE